MPTASERNKSVLGLNLQAKPYLNQARDLPPRARAPKRYLPRDFVYPPALDPTFHPTEITQRQALLINPFYPKDPHASLGKHVLTPSLALTSVAASTPPSWEVSYWDENLLQGPPPCEPFPQVVGITVHLTFARRAYELAGWYRARGAKVILGGLHVFSCPDEAAPHADALAIGEGVGIWARILRDIERDALEPVYNGHYDRPIVRNPRRGVSCCPGAPSSPRAVSSRRAAVTTGAASAT